MAGELRAASSQGLTIRARIINSAARSWNGASFETYSASNIATYAVTLTEQGASGVYVGDFPVAITTAGHYEYFCYSLQGATLDETDTIISTGSVDWDGSASTTPGAAIPSALSGSNWLAYVIQALKRTDKNTEIFEATKDIIDEMRRRILFPENETQADTTDTVSTLGDYRIDLESDFGFLVTDVVLIDGDDGWPLEKISKREFDKRYLGFGTGPSGRNRPVAFCLYGGQLLIGPVPDSVSYVYKISYGMDDLATYSSSTTSIPFTDKYRLTLRRGVLALLFSETLKNDELGAKFGALYEADLRHIEKRIDRNRASTMQTTYRAI